MNQTALFPAAVPTTQVCCSYAVMKSNPSGLKQSNKVDVMNLSRQAICRAEEGKRDLANPTEGRSTYRPSSYTELIDDAVASIVFGVQDNLIRMEVEFPSVSNVDGYKGSSDLYIDSNIQLAIAAGRKIYSTTAMKVHILLPDEPEYKRAYKMYVYSLIISMLLKR